MNTKRTITGGIALAGILVLGSACTPEPESGIVTELEYEPASFITSQNCTYRYDAKGRYKGQTCVPYTTHFPECWDVDYEDDSTGETLEGEDCVSEDLFNALEIGDNYFKGMKVSDVA